MYETHSKKKITRTASFSPLYKQIKDLLVQSLESGEFKPGESIPSEQELALRFEVSQGTVRKAIDELSAENVLIRRQGKGTYVATHHEAQVRYRFLSLYPDSESDTNKRAQPKILESNLAVSTPDQKSVFEFNRGESVFCIKRLMNLADRATVYEEIYLPEPAFAGLSREMLDANSGPLYGFFETQFGVQMIRCDERLRAVSAPADVAALLGVEVNSPLLYIERVSYTYGDKAMEIRKGWYLTQHYHYRNSLN